jgi:hypothetical protein
MHLPFDRFLRSWRYSFPTSCLQHNKPTRYFCYRPLIGPCKPGLPGSPPTRVAMAFAHSQTSSSALPIKPTQLWLR